MTAPVLSPQALRTLAEQILGMATANTTVLRIDHLATGSTRVARGQVRLDNAGDRLQIELHTRFGQRVMFDTQFNQLDPASVRQAVQYAESIARELPGDPADASMPVTPRTYPMNTAWHQTTIDAFSDARHAAVEHVVEPVLSVGYSASAFIGVAVHSRLYADRQGILAVGQETDSEITMTARSSDASGGGWAGQAARDWNTLDIPAISQRAIHMAALARHPVRFEPGRRTVILDRPAVAQLIAGMGQPFDAQGTLRGSGPLYDPQARRPRLGERIIDARLTLSSDPNDPEGGYLPFNGRGFPLVPMTWIDTGGILRNLAYETYFAAARGIAPANDWPESLRLDLAPGTTTSTVEAMIANCKDGIYVNRFAQVRGVDPEHGVLTGVTNGGCFLVRDGKIDKAITDLRFIESPWYVLNRVLAVGTTARAAFGYAPWQGSWPIAPTIVPPLMIRDFNFTALATAV